MSKEAILRYMFMQAFMPCINKISPENAGIPTFLTSFLPSQSSYFSHSRVLQNVKKCNNGK